MDQRRVLDMWQRAKDEADELEMRAHELKETVNKIEALFIRLAELMPDDSTVETSPTSVILDGVETILKANGQTMTTGDILSSLSERGITVGGGNPSSNLSAKLSKDGERFRSYGRGRGWGLVSPPDDDEIPF